MADHKSFWLISGPRTINSQETYAVVNRHVYKETNLAETYKFEVPNELKVGTLDSLMSLSDDLQKMDIYVESVARKIVKQLVDIMEKKPDKSDSLAINGANVETYLTHFAWEEAKYPVRSALRELTDKISQQVSKLDEELKVKAADYNSISHSIAAEERKQGGTLLVKALDDIVKRSDLTETDYLTTLLVVVPKYSIKEWMTTYERLTDYVLPRSTRQITEDNDYALFTVVLFRRVAEDFRNIAREKRFTVRDFKIEEEGKNVAEERSKLLTEKDRQKRNLTRWCKTNFAEAFVAWLHLKAIRIFVESVLRFGLPINFQAVLLLPHKKEDKRLRECLNDCFKHLGTQHTSREKDEDTEKFYPYVFLPIDLNEISFI
eukprot:TRINITY_DN5633_c0_g1_i1.p1 TRINITY_DN5633_c0_g1~~TRINITY_DN5633_c0_g1_i1.p1  ORF type:complete len:376 (-),score=77.83 TRINITY_DN5633_c0_g1_i1:272-1399(-)